MRNVALAAIVFFVFSQNAAADPAWSAISLAATPQNAPKVVAAADKLMASAVGKTFPGKLLLQANVADGDNPATHTFVPIFKNATDRETFVQKMQADPAWTEFQNTMAGASQPGGTAIMRTVKVWGEVVDTDHVWMAHDFDVSDPPAFLAALDALMASPTGQKFPGQVYLSAVVAGGITPVSHTISVGYASEAEMDAWQQTVAATDDWAEYLDATGEAAEYLGTSMARDVKSWGSATLAELVKE